MRRSGGDTTSILQPFVDRHELSGAVTLVADRDRIRNLEAVGYADVAAKTPMRTNSLFWIASQTKPVTATALMMLVDAGQVHLDDAIAQYLPDFAKSMKIVEQDEERVTLQKPTRAITIRHLLNHTSGFPFLTPVEQNAIDILPLPDAMRLYTLAPLLFEPGTQYEYSNVGINIAGRILEIVTGESYASFLQNHLFDPLGMTDTTFWPNPDQLRRLAKAYQPGAENLGLVETPISYLQYPLDNPCRFAAPGGGLFSTAVDVARFCQMILRGGEWNGKWYLSEESVRQMTSRQTAADLKSYGLGWEVGDDEFGHGGAYATKMTIHPSKDRITVFLTQHAGFPGNGGECYPAWQQSVLAHD